MQSIDATKITLNEWLDLLLNTHKKIKFIDDCFPTDKHAQEYLVNIHTRSQDEVYKLLNKLLIRSSSFRYDDLNLMQLLNFPRYQANPSEWLAKNPYYMRLVMYFQDNNNPPPWEGNTWILELLPHYPKKAIDVLDNYLLAHCLLLPDRRIWGLTDAMSIIRAKFIGIPGSNAEKIKFIIELEFRQFEHLIERLYHQMEYDTVLTPGTRDGGLDVIATKELPGQKHKIAVECKLYNHPVGLDIVRNIRGVVEYGGYNKGVLFTTHRFTPQAEELANKDHLIELVSGEKLIILLNEYFGTEWYLRIDKIILESQREHKV
ncbi:hypothetical protein NIES2100_36960 [Calothrix sp. NIES-2100]|uniref:restriction endonuclease n=1 Tax=Calothrix sp. NIES-2100 TaxID=1954172 RepID=UPI000B5F76EA|nr:hypothetical protein NIES2100_36960 [Calothrix sp. NIES-2100]